VEQGGHHYDRHPDDKATALNYARTLRGMTEYLQAAAVFQRLKALAVPALREAADVLPRAHTPDRPNWSILSAQGSVADRLGDHG
jgi:hypothetical protein